jgi:hypothetical protein
LLLSVDGSGIRAIPGIPRSVAGQHRHEC